MRARHGVPDLLARAHGIPDLLTRARHGVLLLGECTLQPIPAPGPGSY